MKILGISSFYHDSAAAIVGDGRVLAAAQEERFTRVKHDSGFPSRAINACLATAGLNPNDIDRVVFYEKPFLKFERIIETCLAEAPRGFTSFQKSMPTWFKEKLFQKSMLLKALSGLGFDKIDGSKLLFSEHHLSHAASAFYPSPFSDAVVLTMDGVGEWATTSVAIGEGLDLKVQKEIHFPHSLGLLYSAFTYYTGFKVNSGEYKVMGLAPYGQPRFTQKIFDHLIDLREDGSFKLNMRYFDYTHGLRMTSPKFAELFDIPVRKAEGKLEPVHMDLAASIQAVTEEVVLRICRALRAETGKRNLCLAGGVALNCVANGKLLRERIFDDIWIQPAAGDAGGALGAALYAHAQLTREPFVRSDQNRDLMRGAYLGPSYSDDQVRTELTTARARFNRLDDEALIEKAVDDLANGRALGWMRGQMEFGPRALGARSILGDPRNPEMQKTLNLKVKFRESFRPFAPMVLIEDLQEWFDIDVESPYMLLVADVAKRRRKSLPSGYESLFGLDKLNIARSEIPAVTHVDFSARVQTVHKETNPFMHRLLSRFKEKTGCPVLVNTSFNVRGEPIVESPTDAFRCLMGTHIESLFVENYYLRKEDQDPQLAKSYEHLFEMD